jgi:hypothetical protein
MKKQLLLVLCFLGSFNLANAQEDSLDVFRNPSKVNSNNSNSTSTGKNALSISIAHLGRGGTMLTYERFINNTPLALYAGLGFMSIDVIGQWSFQDELYLFDNEDATRTSVDLGKTVDLGLKYLFNKELGGSYLGLGYSSYSNGVNLSVDDDYLLVASDSKSNRLRYNSKEFKIVYGAINDAESTFYSDFNFGLGFRFLDYQTLEISEVDEMFTSSFTSPQNKITAKKESESEIKLWLFIGWKIGVRF